MSGKDCSPDCGSLELVEDSPQTTYTNKKTVLRAERRDKVLIDGWFETTVVERTDTYYGPELMLESLGRNYLLYAPGFDRQLLLWEAKLTERGGIKAWKKIGHVNAKISDTAQYEICDQCGRPMRSVEHERLATIGRCPKVSGSKT